MDTAFFEQLLAFLPKENFPKEAVLKCVVYEALFLRKEKK